MIKLKQSQAKTQASVMLMLAAFVCCMILSVGGNASAQPTKLPEQAKGVGDVISNKTHINELRSIDTVRVSNKKAGIYKRYMSYGASKKEILIEDNNYKNKLKIQLVSGYTTYVGAGNDVKVAEFLLVDFDEYVNLFDSIYSFDINNGYEYKERKFTMKYGTDYIAEECHQLNEFGSKYSNATFCVNVTKTNWTEFNSLSELPHKNIKIGLFTDTKVGEKVEWIPNIQGFDILEWANYEIDIDPVWHSGVKYEIKEKKINNKKAIEIKFPTLLKDYPIRDKKFSVKKTNYFGDIDVRLMHYVNVTTNQSYSCNCHNKTIEYPANKTNKTEAYNETNWVCDTCYKDVTTEVFKEIDPETFVLKNNEPIYEVMNKPTKFEKMDNGWGYAVWTDVNIMGVKVEGATWWNSTFEKKKEIQIDNNDLEVANYSLLLNVTYDSDMSPGFEDIRFSNGSENEILSYWIENKVDSLYADVWVKIPETMSNTTNTTIYMYYDNTSVVNSESDFNSAFYFSDDFSGDLSKWTVDSGSWAIVGGMLKNSATGTTGEIVMNNVDIQNFVMNFYERFQIDNSDAGRPHYRYADSSNYWVNDIRLSNTDLLRLVAISGGGVGDSNTSSFSTGTNIMYHRIITTDGTTHISEVVGETDVTITSSDSLASGGIHFWYQSTTGVEQYEIDNVSVRPHLATTPTYSFGAEETSGDATPPTVSWNYPTDDSWNNSRTFNVGFTPVDETVLDNCTLRDNRSGAMADTVGNTSTLVNGSVNTIAETFTSDGHYNISIKCWDTSSNSAETVGRTIKIDSTAPTYSDNSTNTTLAGVPTEFRVKWTDNINLTGGGYIFSWYNGTNWTKTSNSGDLESGEQSFKESTATYTFFDDFDDGDLGSNWTTYRSDTTYGRIGVRTEGTHSGSYSVIADVYTNDHNNLNELITNYNFSGTTSVVLTFWHREWDDEETSGTDHANHYNSDAYYFTCDGTNWKHLGNLGNVADWTKVTINITADPDWCGTADSNFKIKLTQYDNYALTLDGRGFDDINITYTAPTVQDTNKTPVTYSDISLNNYDSLNNITISVYVSYYDNSGSQANGNTNPTLWLEVYNGMDWVDEGDFQVTGTGNYSKIITTSSVLEGWKTESNRDLRISAKYIDYKDSSHYDTINWTGVWVETFSEQELLNDSLVEFNSSNCINDTVCWSNVTKSVNTTVGATIKWKIYANDTSDNWATSTTYSYITTTSDSCTPPASGTWEIDSTDNCLISSKTINIDYIYFTGDGTITFDDCTINIKAFERKSGDGGTNTIITLQNYTNGTLSS